MGGHEKNIILKLERGSAYPSDQFLSELAEAVRLVVEADRIGSKPVMVDQDDYDDTYGDKGYINASAAENILSQQLGRDDLQFVEKGYDLDDGEYEVEFVLDGVEYEYEVNAYTGKVTEVDVDRQDDDRYDDDWDDRYDDDWDDRYDNDDDDWYGDPTGSDYPGDSDDWDDRDDDDWDDRIGTMTGTMMIGMTAMMTMTTGTMTGTMMIGMTAMMTMTTGTMTGTTER